jgi:hypothetical protein
MREENDERGMSSKPTRVGLSIVSANGLRIDRSGLSRKAVQCTTCLQQTEYTEGEESCEMCGAKLSVAESSYSGYDPNFVPICPEVYLLRPPVRTVNERRYPRMRCANVKACIKTAQGTSVVVDMVDVSRGGVCFTSVETFSKGTLVSIATHYIEGGHNIFQDGRIVRVQSKSTALFPGKYAIEFLNTRRLNAVSDAIPGGQPSP